MSFIEVENHFQIVQKSSALIPFLEGDEKSSVETIMKHSKAQLNRIGYENKTVLNPTDFELTTVRVSFMRYVMTDFFNKADVSEMLHPHPWTSEQMHKDRFRKAFDKTLIPNDLKMKYLLLRREDKKSKKRSPLYDPLKMAIRNEVVKLFAEQNQELLKEYGL